jgi:hypothetical protein
MSGAFKCDRCGELHVGKAESSIDIDPSGIATSVSPGGVSLGAPGLGISSAELCERCTHDFEYWWITVVRSANGQI